VEQIINKKIKLTEKRFLIITSLFFLVFSYEVGYFNYNNLKLIFWGSLFSIYGIKRNDNILEFELNKNRNEKIKLSLITNEGQKIKNILLYILKVRGVGYLIEDNKNNKNKNNKNKNKDNQQLNEQNNNNENYEKKRNFLSFILKILPFFLIAIVFLLIFIKIWMKCKKNKKNSNKNNNKNKNNKNKKKNMKVHKKRKRELVTIIHFVEVIL
jgi:ATP-dependent Zn protease